MNKTENFEESSSRETPYAGKPIAVVSDGSAVAGQGNIGGHAALPAAEEKARLLKDHAGIDAIPICLSTQKPDEIIQTIERISPTFSGVCLEGITAPGCFEIERRLSGKLDIPVFHDAGRGTAAVVGAAVLNAYRFLGRPLKEIRAVVCGAGAAGNPVAKTLLAIGIRDILVCDSKGILCPSRIPEFGEDKLELIEFTNRDGLNGTLSDAVKGRDLFIGVSKGEVLSEPKVQMMAKNPVVMALALPEPEILPDAARNAGAKIVCTGMRNSPNHIDNLLVLPGIFRGALDAGASEITDRMVFAAMHALSEMIPDSDLSEKKILPYVSGGNTCQVIADAVSKAWTAK